MGVTPVLAKVALPSAARTTTAQSGAVAPAGMAAAALAMVHCTAASGTSPTLNVSLEESDDGASWTAVPNSGATQLTAAGNAVGSGRVTKNLVRATAAIGGTTPSFTFSVTVLVIPEG